MAWWNCRVCDEKDRRIKALEAEIQSLKSQLCHSREREECAVDQLLARKGDDSIRPTGKMSEVDSMKAMEQLFGIFKDEDDKGDGTIVDADQLDASKPVDLHGRR